MAQKSREEGEIGSESREKGDLPPCSPPINRAQVYFMLPTPESIPVMAGNYCVSAPRGILVPRAYDPSGLRQESRALGATIMKEQRK